MKKIITGILLVLGMLAGGMVASAPAQAEVAAVAQAADGGASTQAVNTDVSFAWLGDGVPATIDLYNTSYTGYEYLQSYQTTRHNVSVVCPKPTAGDTWGLYYRNPRGTYVTMQPGDCASISLEGNYTFGVYKSF